VDPDLRTLHLMNVFGAGQVHGEGGRMGGEVLHSCLLLPTLQHWRLRGQVGTILAAHWLLQGRWEKSSLPIGCGRAVYNNPHRLSAGSGQVGTILAAYWLLQGSWE